MNTTQARQPEDEPYLVNITTTNPNPQLGHRRKPIYLPAQFDYVDERGQVQWMPFYDEHRQPSRLLLPLWLDKRKPIDEHNIAAIKLYKELGKGMSEFIHIVDPTEKADKDTKNLIRATKIKSRLTELFEAGDHETLASLYRRHWSTTRGKTPKMVLLALSALADEDPDAVERWMSGDVDPLYFVLDQACEAGGPIVREGESYWLRAAPDNLLASSTRQMVKYLREHPTFLDAVKRRLENPDVSLRAPAVLRFEQETTGITEEAEPVGGDQDPSAVAQALLEGPDVRSVLEAAIGAQVVTKVNGTSWRLPNGTPKGIVGSLEQLEKFLSNPQNGAALARLRENVEELADA